MKFIKPIIAALIFVPVLAFAQAQLTVHVTYVPSKAAFEFQPERLRFATKTSDGNEDTYTLRAGQVPASIQYIVQPKIGNGMCNVSVSITGDNIIQAVAKPSGQSIGCSSSIDNNKKEVNITVTKPQ